MQIALTVLGVLFVGVSACLGWALRERWVARHAVRALAREVAERDWHRWWLRNAAECTPLDPARQHMLRLALAAQLAPSLALFEADLHSLRNDPTRDPLERDVAKAFSSELEVSRRVREAPWLAWERDTGKPRWNPEAQRVAYACALVGWLAFFTRKLDAESESNSPEIVEADQKH